MLKEINTVDLAFVVDTTGSMGGLIEAARLQMIDMMQQLARAADINLHLGIVEYRDHPPQDPLIYRVHNLTPDLKKAQKTLQGLQAAGGGDGPEAVLDGIVAACKELQWRKHARRIGVLVGDAPPHGIGAAGDSFPRGCPCGETIESVTRLAEETLATFHTISLTQLASDAFRTLSSLTGGMFFSAQKADAAIEHLVGLLKAEFSDLELDRQVLAAWQANPHISIDELAESTATSRHAVSAAFVRLLSRDLVQAPVVQRQNTQ